MSNSLIQLTYQYNVTFWDLDFLTLEDGTERLSGNDYELPTYAAQHSSRAKVWVNLISNKIWSSHWIDYNDYWIPGCGIVQSSRNVEFETKN